MHIITYTQKENILKGKIKMNIIEALVFSCTQGIDRISIAHFMGLWFLETTDFEPQVFYFHLPHYLYPSELSLSR